MPLPRLSMEILKPSDQDEITQPNVLEDEITQPIYHDEILKPGQIPTKTKEELAQEPMFPRVERSVDVMEIMKKASPEERKNMADIAWEIGKEYGPDVALMIASGAMGAAVVGTGGALAPLTPLAAGVLSGLTGGAIYRAAKGAIEGKGPLDTFQEIPEEMAWWGGLPVAGKLAKGMTKPLAKASEKYWQPIAGKLWQVITWPANVRIPWANKSIRELGQPAIDRLMEKAPKTGEAFRESRAQMQITTGIGRQLAVDTANLLPSERFEVLKGLRGASKRGMSPNARAALKRYEGSIYGADLDSRYAARYHEELSRLLTKQIEKPEVVMVGSSTRNLLRNLEQGIKSKDYHASQKVLEDLMLHPSTSSEMKVLAKDLYNLPARSPVDVAKASRAAARSYLLHELKTQPGKLVSDTMKPGYVVSKISGLKGLYVNRDIELELEAINKIPKIAEGMMQKWFIGPWKTSKVVLRPATHFRNTISNLILNDWGGLPFWRQDVYMKAIGEMRGQSANWKSFARISGLGGTFTQQEVHMGMKAMEYGSNMFDRLLNL